MAARRGAGRHDLLRVFVAQLVQREGAAIGQRSRLREPLRLVQRLQPADRAQMLLGIGLQLPTASGERQAQPRGGQRVLQRFARAHMHQHIACGGHGQAGDFRHPLHMLDQNVIPRAQQHRQCDRRAVAEQGLEPLRMGQHLIEGLRDIGHQQRQATGQTGDQAVARAVMRAVGRGLDVRPVRVIATFAGALPRPRDPLRQLPVAGTCLRQQHQAHRRHRRATHVGVAGTHGRQHPHLGPDDQVQPTALGRLMRMHHPRQRTLIGDRQGAVPQLHRARDQLLRMRGTAQEAEIAAALEFGVGGHGRCIQRLYFHTVF